MFKDGCKTLDNSHVSEETAYEVQNYPYGYTQRCKIRYWVETTKRGQRFCRQTQNPKTGKWNSPKKSIYYPIVKMYLDVHEHVQYAILNVFDSEDAANQFSKTFALTEEDQKTVKQMIAYHRGMKHISVQITQTNEPRQTLAEQQKIIQACVCYELSKMDVSKMDGVKNGK